MGKSKGGMAKAEAQLMAGKAGVPGAGVDILGKQALGSNSAGLLVSLGQPLLAQGLYSTTTLSFLPSLPCCCRQPTAAAASTHICAASALLLSCSGLSQHARQHAHAKEV